MSPTSFYALAAGAASDGLDHAVEEARWFALPEHLHADAGGLADELGEVDGFGIGGEGVDLKAEELGETFDAFDGADEQLVFAQRGDELQESVFLCQIRHAALLPSLG